MDSIADPQQNGPDLQKMDRIHTKMDLIRCKMYRSTVLLQNGPDAQQNGLDPLKMDRIRTEMDRIRT